MRQQSYQPLPLFLFLFLPVSSFLPVTNLTLVDGLSCGEQSFSALNTDLGFLHIIQRISILAPLSLFHVYIEVSDDQTAKIQLRSPNGSPLILYSSLSATASEWQTLDVLTKRIYIAPVYSSDADIIPTVVITSCKYSTSISYFNDNMYSVDTHKAGIVSIYENHLIVMFRTLENGIFIFSMAEQGDLLIAQIVHGKIFIIFDFGSLTQTTISGGTALNDGEWHEIRWIHQFDSVQLYVDGVIMNTTASSGLYRKLDFDTKIYVGGRPMDDMNIGVEMSYHGCLARVMLNNIDLLAEIPRSLRKDCQMPKSQSMTIMTGGYVSIPFSFLPFSIEFRILSQPTSILLLTDANNKSLAQIALDRNGLLVLTLFANMAEVEQLPYSGKLVNDSSWHSLSLMIWGARLYVDLDSYTSLWSEGNAIRNLAKQLTHFHLSAVGCYRSGTVAFKSSNLIGNVTLDACHFQERCLPNPCENHAICNQISLNDFHCNCRDDYYGKTCHATRKYHSCEEFFLKNPQIKSKNVTIDLDGGNPLEPLTVQCEQNVNDYGDRRITSKIFHLERSDIIINGDYEPGSVKKSLDYGIATDQLDRFINGFENCVQYMRYECRGGAKLMSYGVERRPSSWYSTRNGQHAMQWGDAPPYSRMCSCAANSSCTHNRMCNCDSGEDDVDEGYNPHIQLLPVMNLYLGGTTATSSISVFIGPLICSQRHVFDGITFLNRNARLVGSQALFGSVMDLEFQIRMSHARMTIFIWESLNRQHWYKLDLTDGRLVGQVVCGNKVFEIQSKMRVNDNRWHTVYWEVNMNGMMLNVDNESILLDVYIIPPNVYTWIIGSRTEHGLSGFAGQIRNMYLCGNEIMLRPLVRKQGRSDIELGEKGTCKSDDCLNHGQCIEFYDSHKCNCDNTPFIGQKCDQDASIFVPKGAELTIPWQHPAQVSSCFRIAVQSFSSNYSLMKAKALFADGQFNLTINQKGYLELSIFDGFFFYYKAADTTHKFDDNKLTDVNFCAKNTKFTLQINGEDVFFINGNWSFFPQLNVWKFIDKNFTGCLSRLQVGISFPLKDPSSSRLSYRNGIRFEGCSYNHTSFNQMPKQEEKSLLSNIHINAIIEHRTSSLALAPVIGVATGSCLFLLILIVVICWIRNRPDGVYKTNEDILAYCSPNRSKEPLVAINCVNREYYC